MLEGMTQGWTETIDKLVIHLSPGSVAGYRIDDRL
jgi:hypothetical protein